MATLLDIELSRPPKRRRVGNLSVVSLFSGCGGMDLGFRGGFSTLGKDYARLPFRIDFANDFNARACETYRAFFGHDIIHGDIWEQMPKLPDTADVVVGGFPCQDISVNGKRRGVAGERSGLYRAMVEVVRRVRPRIFVAENVKGLLMKYNQGSLKQVIEDFSALGYSVGYKLYHAADYGVPQNRERVFIVGTAPGVRSFTPPQPVLSRSEWVVASHAIRDLEPLAEHDAPNHTWSRAGRSAEQGDRRLKREKIAATIRAECHGNSQFHYSGRRRISIREAARFQTFPDDFVFKGGIRECERQVGNAVPPVLAWHVAQAVLDSLSS